MEQCIRTDIALEAARLTDEKIAGIEIDEDNSGDIKVTRVRVENDEAAQKIGKPKGKYITVDMPMITQAEPEIYKRCGEAAVQCIKEMTEVSDDALIMVIGLGNRHVTADALGPKVVDKLVVTRHMFANAPEVLHEGMRPTCALAPGVLGITGMETGEVVSGVIEKVKPDMVIAVDALASRSIDRVGRSIQLADSGIVPGSGLGNRRMELSRATLGIPVIAIGVPTVVDAATMANDTIELTIQKIASETKENKSLFGLLSRLTGPQKYLLFREILYPSVGDMVVTPKDIDALTEKMAGVIANGINFSLHKNFGQGDIERYIVN